MNLIGFDGIEAGVVVFDAAARRADLAEVEVLQGLTEADQQQLVRILGAVAQSLGERPC